MGDYRYGWNSTPLSFPVRPQTIPERLPRGEARRSEQNADVSLITDVGQNIRVALSSFSGTDIQRERLAKVLKPFSHMFTEIPGKTNILEHQIDTGDARPIRFNARPLSVHKRELLDRALEEMIETKTIRPSNSPWAFPIVLAPKKDGTARLCVDYRPLNAMTRRDAYPVPSISSVMYALGSASIFTTLDCSRGFFQIPVAKADTPKTAFICQRGLFEFDRLPFGLSNSPASFQRLMDTVLGDTKFHCAMAYMDDVVVFSKTLDDHINHLQVVLQRMNDAGLTINPKKVQLASSRVALLGFVVEHGFLHPQEEKLKAMIEFPTPQDKKRLQRYLGMVGFYRQFISNCADLARPLHELLRRDVPWNWTAAHEEAFRTLAVAIADTASIRLPDLNATFVLQTDASEYGLGVVLLQEHNGALRPVAFASHTLSAAERNYTVTEKECLAIIFALKKFDMYLDGATFTIQTDHQALTWLKNLKNPAGRLARLALTLQGYNFSIEYRPGKSNIAADALSRAPLPPQEKEEATELVAVTNEELSWGVVVTREQLLRAQRADDLHQHCI